LWIPQWTAAQQEYLAVRQLGDAALTRGGRARLGFVFFPEYLNIFIDPIGKTHNNHKISTHPGGYVVNLEIIIIK
ncbi:efflux RND transporter periplasmic adaptor subunit, partial [Enterobacter intestinihominis]